MTKIKEPEGGWQKTIRMPKKLWKKWDKALRGGTYMQGKNTLYNPETARFCCLGVLQHIATGGEVELNDYTTDQFAACPSLEWLDSNGIQFLTNKGDRTDNPALPSLGNRIDRGTITVPYCAVTANDAGKKFTTIADAIARHVEFTDA